MATSAATFEDSTSGGKSLPTPLAATPGMEENSSSTKRPRFSFESDTLALKNNPE